MNKTWGLWIVIGLCVVGAVACGTDPPQEPEPARPAEGGAPQLPPQLLEAMFAAVERDPSDLEAHHRLAIALHRVGRRDEAIGHFEAIVQLEPNAQHLLELGVAYASVSRTEDAEAVLRQALELTPDDPTIFHHLGNLSRRRGDTAGAIELYGQALEINPAYIMARFHLAETQRQAQQFREAYRSYEQVLSHEPATELELQTVNEALFHLGSLDLQMGATERAVEFFETLVSRAPDHPEAHRALGEALMRLGRNEEAQAEFEAHRRLITQSQS
jgi:tetratricopeptide (TPR) repeat protein